MMKFAAKIAGLALLLVLAGCASVTRHPEFPKDCQALEANVDCVRVFYGTNRAILTQTKAPDVAGQARDVAAFSNEAGDQLVVGRADVWLPILKEKGGTRERGTMPKLTGTPPKEQSELEKYVFVTRITATETQAFTTELARAVADEDDSILLFVHGFNVKFDDALINAAQLYVDLANPNEATPFRPGAPILFSWPSDGQVAPWHYYSDRKDSLGAAPRLAEFLDMITANPKLRRVNILAHSMGNRVLTRALQDFAADYLKTHPDHKIEFRVILAAADVETTVFDLAVGKFEAIEPNVVIYASSGDRALVASRLVQGWPLNWNVEHRLGDANNGAPYIRKDQRFTTIDASNVATELFGLGHGYYSDRPFILNDIRCTLLDLPLRDRALKLTRRKGDGLPYYDLEAGLQSSDSECSLTRKTVPVSSETPESAAPPRGSAPPTSAPPPRPMPSSP
ncbi:MAG: alpha/beta hydrolase, partial [Hyphomonadaceae bacterium]